MDVSEEPNPEHRQANPAWLALPLLVIALIALIVGLVASRTTRQPYSAPFSHPFFRDVLQIKA